MTADVTPLLARVRAEYREMPGLRLTVPQAARLWQIDLTLCRAILQALVRERYLLCTAAGAFVRAEA